MPKDLFAQVPEFLAAFRNILNNGFFEEIQFSTGNEMSEGTVYSCCITAAGCIPSNKKFGADGCGAIINPKTIIAACRKLATQKKVKGVTTKVETKDWPLWDAKGENVVGSKGKRIGLFLQITFKT